MSLVGGEMEMVSDPFPDRTMEVRDARLDVVELHPSNFREVVPRLCRTTEVRHNEDRCHDTICASAVAHIIDRLATDVHRVTDVETTRLFKSFSLGRRLQRDVRGINEPARKPPARLTRLATKQDFARLVPYDGDVNRGIGRRKPIQRGVDYSLAERFAADRQLNSLGQLARAILIEDLVEHAGLEATRVRRNETLARTVEDHFAPGLGARRDTLVERHAPCGVRCPIHNRPHDRLWISLPDHSCPRCNVERVTVGPLPATVAQDNEQRLVARRHFMQQTPIPLVQPMHLEPSDDDPERCVLFCIHDSPVLLSKGPPRSDSPEAPPFCKGDVSGQF